MRRVKGARRPRPRQPRQRRSRLRPPGHELNTLYLGAAVAVFLRFGKMDGGEG